MRIVVLNWNRFALTNTCIESLLAAGCPLESLIVVDNGSRDGSPDQLAQAHPGLSLIRNPVNSGFARGCNIGIREALRQDADYVLLLNNDCEVTEGFLTALIERAEAVPNVGLVSGKILLSGQRDTIWYAGASRRRLLGGVGVRGWWQKDLGQYDRDDDTEGCTGAMMLISRRVLDTVGLLPEQYFFGMEEWDYSETVRRAGFRLLYAPKSVVYHLSDGSHSNQSPKFVYCGHRNQLIYQTRFLGRTATAVWIRVYSVYHQFVAPRRLGLGNETPVHRAAWKAAVRDHRRSERLWVEESELIEFERLADKIRDRVAANTRGDDSASQPSPREAAEPNSPGRVAAARDPLAQPRM